jgi:hypothetical protein
MDLIPITRALQAFAWFLGQSVSVGGLGNYLFWLPFLALVAGLVVAWLTSSVDRRRLWILLVLPALWILTGLLGGYYWMDWARVPVQYPPSWILFALKFNILSFLLVGPISILYLRDARWFASIDFVINLYFTITMTVLSGMAVSGDWL